MLIGIPAYNADPDNWFSIFGCRRVHGFNLSNWCYQPFESLIQQAVQTNDTARRSRLYVQAQQILKRERPFTPIAYPTVYQPISKQVVNFKIVPLGSTRFAGVGLK